MASGGGGDGGGGARYVAPVVASLGKLGCIGIGCTHADMLIRAVQGRPLRSDGIHDGRVC